MSTHDRSGPVPRVPGSTDAAGTAFELLLRGQIARAEASAARVLGSGPDAPATVAPGTDQRSRSLAGAVIGVVSSLRGAPADTWFDEAVAGAERSGDRTTQSLVLALWAEHGWRVDARAALRHAARAVSLAEQTGDRRLLRDADRSRAVAALGAGDLDAATMIAERLRQTAADACETARTSFVLGVAAVHRRQFEDATAALTTVVDTFEQLGYDLELLLALLWLSVSDHEHAPVHLGRARTLTSELDPDPALERLWAERPSLRLHVLGEQSLTVGADAVRAKTTHAEKLVFSLAFAGAVGLDVDEVCERLWPEKDRGKALSSLTTATWDARTALGTEAWRLTRTDERFNLAMEGVRIDLDDAVDRLERGVADDDDLARLERPALPAWRFEDWVAEIDERRAAILARHRTGPRKAGGLDGSVTDV